MIFIPGTVLHHLSEQLIFFLGLFIVIVQQFTVCLVPTFYFLLLVFFSEWTAPRALFHTCFCV